MNTKMYEHPTTKESVERLKKMKIDILETASGVLACGEIGSGRLLDPDLILTEIDQALEVTIVQNSNDKLIPFGQKSVLITSGGTTEPIDDVRVITNRSTGRTAAKLADSLTALGLSVTYLHSENAVKPLLSCELISYNDFQSLQKHLESLTKENFYHTIFHAAAVSDYSVIPYLGKINSDLEEIQITLKKNPKLIDSIKKWAPQSQLVGFKLTSQLDDNSILAKVQNLFKNSSCDYVIQNDWNDVRNRNEKYRIYKKHSSPHYEEIKSTEELHAVVTQILLTQEQL